MRRRTSSGCATTSNPMTDAVPLVGRTSVVSIFRVVVLPAPFGPSRPKMLPRLTANDIPSTARTDVREPRENKRGSKTFTRLSTCNANSDIKTFRASFMAQISGCNSARGCGSSLKKLMSARRSEFAREVREDLYGRTAMRIFIWTPASLYFLVMAAYPLGMSLSNSAPQTAANDAAKTAAQTRAWRQAHEAAVMNE